MSKHSTSTRDETDMYVAWVGAGKQWVSWRAFDYCVEICESTPSEPLSGMHRLGVDNLCAVFRDHRSSETLTRQNYEGESKP